MKSIKLISDAHGAYPYDLYVEGDFDICIDAGDFSPTWSHEEHYQRAAFRDEYLQFISGLPCKHFVFIAGNHDFLCERPWFYRLVAEYDEKRQDDWPELHYLQDSFVVIDGKKIWGSPWSPKFGSWAFMDDDESLGYRYNKIPDDVDIIVSHGPPNMAYGDYKLDMVNEFGYGVHKGSDALRRTIISIQPEFVVCGHIHEGYGVGKINDTVVYNASLRDEFYQVANPPIRLEL